MNTDAVRPCAKCKKTIQSHENAVWRRVDGELTSYHLTCAGENPNPVKAPTKTPKKPKAPKTPTSIEVDFTVPTLPAGVYFNMTPDEITTLLKGRALTLAEPTECPRCGFMMSTGDEVLLTEANELIHGECPK
jgi:hypothetical protein